MSTLKVTNIAGLTGSSTNVMEGLAKAWVNLNGTGTPAARDSLNLSSITDYSANLKNDPNRSNFFGTYKRTNPSFNARIEQAEKEGKSKKVARLKKRQNNFNRNQGDAPSNV